VQCSNRIRAEKFHRRARLSRLSRLAASSRPALRAWSRQPRARRHPRSVRAGGRPNPQHTAHFEHFSPPSTPDKCSRSTRAPITPAESARKIIGIFKPLISPAPLSPEFGEFDDGRRKRRGVIFFCGDAYTASLQRREANGVPPLELTQPAAGISSQAQGASAPPPQPGRGKSRLNCPDVRHSIGAGHANKSGACRCFTRISSRTVALVQLRIS
jgi:hypothetical protein